MAFNAPKYLRIHIKMRSKRALNVYSISCYYHYNVVIIINEIKRYLFKIALGEELLAVVTV